MKNKNIFKILSNVSFGIGLALFAYYIFDFISSRAGLPVDVCPFDNSRPFAIAAACVLVVSLIFSFFDKRTSKKITDKDKDNNEPKEKE